jgi:hypothetical protein
MSVLSNILSLLSRGMDIKVNLSVMTVSFYVQGLTTWIKGISISKNIHLDSIMGSAMGAAPTAATELLVKLKIAAPLHDLIFYKNWGNQWRSLAGNYLLKAFRIHLHIYGESRLVLDSRGPADTIVRTTKVLV